MYTYGVVISTAFSYLASFMIFPCLSQPYSTDEAINYLYEKTTIESISEAIENGKLAIYNGNYAQAFYNLVKNLGINDNEIIDEEVATSIIIKLAFMNGEFTKFLLAKDAYTKTAYTGSMFAGQDAQDVDCDCANNNQEVENNQQAEDNQEAENNQDGCDCANGADEGNNVANGEVIEDWDEFLTEFFYGIGIYDEVNLEDLGDYIKADLYNQELDFHEYSCQTAMIEQFGKNEAVKRGFSDTNHMQSYLAAAGVVSSSSTMTAGAIAGIAIAVAAVVAAVVGIAYKSGKGQADKKLPLVASDQGNYHEHTDPSTGSSALSRFRTLANFGGVKMSVAR